MSDQNSTGETGKTAVLPKYSEILTLYQSQPEGVDYSHHIGCLTLKIPILRPCSNTKLVRNNQHTEYAGFHRIDI